MNERVRTARQRPQMEPLEDRKLFTAVDLDFPRVSPQTDGAPVPLTWLSMPDAVEASLTVSRNGSPTFNGAVATNGSFAYGNELGDYAASITVRDAVGNSASDTHAWSVVDDDTTGPAIVLDFPRVSPQFDNAPVALTWQPGPDVTDMFLTVTRDGVEVFSGPAPASLSLNYGNALGTYVATIVAYDNDTDRGPSDRSSSTDTHTWVVEDEDTTGPAIVLDFPRVSPQFDNAPVALTWQPGPDVTDMFLTVTRDGVEVFSGPAPASRSLNYGNELGHYVATIVAYDNDTDRGLADRSSSTDTHEWDVLDEDTTGPGIVLDFPRVSPQFDDAPVALTWQPGPDVTEMFLTVIRDGVEVFSGPAPTGASLNYGNTLGHYVATIVAYDNDTDRGPSDRSSSTDTLEWDVQDEDTTGPSLNFDHPRLTPQFDGNASPLSWIMSADVSEAVLIVTLDGEQIFQGSPPPGGSLVYGNRLGSYVATLTALDNDTDRGPADRSSSTTTHSWTVVDDDTAAPVVTAASNPGGSETQAGTTARTLSWNVSDGSGLASVVVRVTRDTGSGPQQIFENTSAGMAGSVDITAQGTGLFVITVSATDADNDRPGDALAATASKSLNVLPAPTTPSPLPPPVLTGSAALESDPLNSGRKMLIVRGTDSGDMIVVTRALGVTINGQSRGSFGSTAVSRVVVYGLGGDDFVWLADTHTGNGDSDDCVFNRVLQPTWVFGGAGNDLLVGGSGGGLIAGDAGRDLVLGGAGRDLLIGGLGSDIVIGSGADDILIAGYTSYDANETALNGVLREWSRTDRTYAGRVNALKNTPGTTGLNGSFGLRTDGATQTVFDDGAADEVDLLAGMSGEDWFLYNTGSEGGARDLVVSGGGEVLSDIDRT